MQEHEVLPINTFYGFLDSKKISPTDVEEFIEGIAASDQYDWMGAVESEQLLKLTNTSTMHSEIIKRSAVTIYLLGVKSPGSYMPHQLDQIARYTAAVQNLNKQLFPETIIDIQRLNPSEYDMLGAQRHVEDIINQTPKSSIIFSVDLVANLPIPIER